jgi:ABC-type amino acid transport substrate-binding protein
MAVAVTAMAGDVATARKELASTGSLRIGVVSAPKANVFFVTQDADGRPHGVTVDLGDELARSLDVAGKFYVFPNSGEVTDALEKRLIDVTFVPVDDQRKKRVDFGPAYFQFESTCLVPAAPTSGRTAISISQACGSPAKLIRLPFALPSTCSNLRLSLLCRRSRKP